MDKEIIRRIVKLERWKDELRLPEVSTDLLRTRFKEFGSHLPGINIFVDTGSVYHSGATIIMNDVYGVGTLTFTGTVNEETLVQYAVLDGTQHLAGLTRGNILGTESYVVDNGLTLGAWVKFTTLTNEQAIISRWDPNPSGSSEYQYLLRKTSSHTASFCISDDGSTIYEIASDVTLSADTWYFIVGKWLPGDSMSITVDSTVKTAATVVNAPLASKDSLYIGRIGAITGDKYYMTGQLAYPFIAASPISDANLAKLNTLFTALF